jgi:hypothetical protein
MGTVTLHLSTGVWLKTEDPIKSRATNIITFCISDMSFLVFFYVCSGDPPEVMTFHLNGSRFFLPGRVLLFVVFPGSSFGNPFSEGGER